MTDKVQKIREEVVRLKSRICNNSFLSDYEKGCNDGREDMCDELISIIDSLQEGPVSIWHDASETPKGAGDKEILVQFSDWHTSVLEIDDWEYLDHQTKWAYLKDLI